MREIKFRAWCPIEEEMCETFTLVEAILSNESKIHEEEDIVMQYTGMVDSNGKEIYEGDIVDRTFGGLQKNEEIYKVSWEDFCWCFVGIHKFQKETSSNMLADSSVFEVIGNIYQNKNLLKWEK